MRKCRLFVGCWQYRHQHRLVVCTVDWCDSGVITDFIFTQQTVFSHSRLVSHFPTHLLVFQSYFKFHNTDTEIYWPFVIECILFQFSRLFYFPTTLFSTTITTWMAFFATTFILREQQNYVGCRPDTTPNRPSLYRSSCSGGTTLFSNYFVFSSTSLLFSNVE